METTEFLELLQAVNRNGNGTARLNRNPHRRKVKKIIRLGERATKRALSARYRREFSERLDYGR